MEWTRNMKSFSQQLVSGQWTCNNSGRHALPAVCWVPSQVSCLYTQRMCPSVWHNLRMHACMCVCMYVCMYVWVWVWVWVCVCMCVYVCEHIHYLNFIYILHYHSFSFSLCQDWHSSQKGTPILAFFSRHCWQHPQICQTWLLQIVGWNFQLPLGLPSSLTELNFSSYGETWWEFHQQSLSMNWTQRLV